MELNKQGVVAPSGFFGSIVKALKGSKISKRDEREESIVSTSGKPMDISFSSGNFSLNSSGKDSSKKND